MKQVTIKSSFIRVVNETISLYFLKAPSAVLQYHKIRLGTTEQRYLIRFCELEDSGKTSSYVSKNWMYTATDVTNKRINW